MKTSGTQWKPVVNPVYFSTGPHESSPFLAYQGPSHTLGLSKSSQEAATYTDIALNPKNNHLPLCIETVYVLFFVCIIYLYTRLARLWENAFHSLEFHTLRSFPPQSVFWLFSFGIKCHIKQGAAFSMSSWLNLLYYISVFRSRRHRQTIQYLITHNVHSKCLHLAIH